MDCRRKQNPRAYTTDRWRGSRFSLPSGSLPEGEDDKHPLHTCIFVSEASRTLLSYKPTVSPLSTNVSLHCSWLSQSSFSALQCPNKVLVWVNPTTGVNFLTPNLFPLHAPHSQSPYSCVPSPNISLVFWAPWELREDMARAFSAAAGN